MWTLMKQLLQKIDEITPVSCRRKFDFNNLGYCTLIGIMGALLIFENTPWDDSP